ncbi:N-acetylmuramoyl-L-alanine amidase CwlD [Paludifilum halophilum]|uniref:N-acetylmuramoyl-L-alanine amidase CwlD n=1 Tax=Paludifilum halophilum TaxID=1642702 RepID=A0A235B2M3_9BACL|nr:N-acetylmuramoyl-L-alanine amidase CwlD [Paludifilum halophilum]OYD06502.1 N-acetylmuramoyl-L-alanine amidase CwlD [Paludifilum halophilum]
MERLWREWLRGRSRIFWIGWGFLAVAVIALIVTGLPWGSSENVWSRPLSGRVIVIDPGHGGKDGGAISRGGLVEKDVTLNISLYLRDYLQESGALVIMTRETDTDLADEGARRGKTQDLMRRAHIVKNSHADAFISIHLNAIPSPRWSGAQTFYYPILEDNKKLATEIQQEIIRNLQNTKRSARHSGDVYILKTSRIPSALVEVGFLSNPEEAERLADSEYQTKAAAAIYHGILRFYSDEE